MKTLQELTRPNIWKLKPYSSARDEYKGYTASVFLDANENPYNTPHNRYPDPMQCELKTLLSKIKKVSPEHIFLGDRYSGRLECFRKDRFFILDGQ